MADAFSAPLPEMLSMLPQILAIVQIVSYIALSLVFGSVALRGLKKQISFLAKIALTFGAGFICLLGGISVSNLFPLNDVIFKMLQAGIIIGGMIISVVFAAGFYLLSYTSKKKDFKEEVEEELKEIKTALKEHHLISTVSDKKAKSIAENAAKNYKAGKAEMIGDIWSVEMESGNKKARVVLDSHSGEVKNIFYHESRLLNFFHDPRNAVGIAIVIAVLMFSVLSFSGFPNMLDSVAVLIGMSPEELSGLMGSEPANLPEGCVSAGALLRTYSSDLMNNKLPVYTNSALKSAIEEGSGETVFLMYKVDYNNKPYIIAITLPKGMGIEDLDANEIASKANACSATETKFCNCLKTR
jgi:hypothetical protein